MHLWRSFCIVSITPTGAGCINASSLLSICFWRFSGHLASVDSNVLRLACFSIIETILFCTPGSCFLPSCLLLKTSRLRKHRTFPNRKSSFDSSWWLCSPWSSNGRPSWQQPTGKLREYQRSKIPNQLVTSDVKKAGYPFGYVISTCVLNSVSAWVPGFLDTDLSKMTTATTLGGKVCCSCSLICVGCRTQKQRKVPPTKNNINKINKIVDLQDSIRIPFLPLFCLFGPGTPAEKRTIPHSPFMPSYLGDSPQLGSWGHCDIRQDGILLMKTLWNQEFRI